MKKSRTASGLSDENNRNEMMKLLMISTLSAISLLACSNNPRIGNQPSEKAPRLTQDFVDSDRMVWNNPALFGPVPDHLASAGRAACSAHDTETAHYKAIGYHPKAENSDGTPFLEGGFYCAPAK